MKDISCDIIKDLLPLYIDDICSEQSKHLIDDHVTNCEKCRKILESSRTNILSTQLDVTSTDENTLQNPFLKVKRKQRIQVAGAVIITVILMTILWLLIENIGFLNQRIFENKSYMVTINENNDVWTEIGQFKSSALLFKHRITNHANSAGGCHIRIKKGNDLVLDDYYIENGESFSAELARGEEFTIEIMANEGQYFININ